MTASFQPQPVRSFQVDQLRVHVFASNDDMSVAVATHVHAYLMETLARQGSAAVILATGNSQIRFLKRLVDAGGLDWSKITLFHMDEYLGIAGSHPSSFRYYLRERVESLVKPKAFHYIQGDAELPLDECARYTALLQAQPIDLVCLGVGENGHLAFNDPPVARFDDPYLIKLVKLDDGCKMQQVREGHFPSLEAVPPYALTLTVPALCLPKKMICVAPEKRKAMPIKHALQGPVSTACPASFLRRQSHCDLLLDVDSASLL